MFSTLNDFAINQKKQMISSDNWNITEDNIDNLRIGLTEQLNDSGWANLHHNFNHLSKLGILVNEVLLYSFQGWNGFTNYRFYYNSDSGLLSIPISSFIKYFDYTTPNIEELELATEYFKNKGHEFNEQNIVYKTLNGGFETFNVECISDHYLKNIVNEGEYLELSDEATKSIYKTRATLQKKYSELENWDLNDLISKLGDEKSDNPINVDMNELFEKINDDDNQPKSKLILQSTNRAYTTVQEDKFNKSTTIYWNSWETKPSGGAMLNAKASLGIIWYLDSFAMMGVSEGLGMGMSIIEEKNKRVIIIHYEYHRWEWMHIGRGSIKILIDNDLVIELSGQETRTHVYSEAKRGGKIFEQGYWAISESDFKKACDGQNVEVRISGGSGFYIEFDEPHNKDFHFMLRSMYNESFDPTLYLDSIQSRKPPKKSKSGCMGVIAFFIILSFMAFV